ncbi:MAG: AAA family ATPase, partial [Alphaproteobacteria bacterium]|nr:AAA family ATPase [Alphaproteobacteria bacterium]
MLQEATKAINSAFNNSFIKKLSLYLHDCVREEVQSSTFRNLKGDKDNKWIFLKGEESLLRSNEDFLRLDGSDAKLTELMTLSSNSVKDKYLIYGYLFLVGKNSKNRRASEFLTPLLYLPCHLERNGVNINCIPQEEVLSLNTGALTALMGKQDDEDAAEQLLSGLLEVVPTLPITDESLEIFLTTLKAIIPEIDINISDENNVDEDNVTPDEETDFYSEKIDGDNVSFVIGEVEAKQKQVKKLEKINLTNQAAIILTKRPSVTAGVLHELTQIAERPSGIYRETALNVINEEYSISKEKSAPIKDMKSITDFYPITPLSLSDSQEQVIKNIDNNKFIAVQGPPGTGKSQTIVNLVAHLIANGKTVLVASRMDKAVDVVADRLNELGAPFLALRAGRMNYQKQLSNQLNDLLNGKVDIDNDYEDSLFAGTDDMKDHINLVREYESRCEQIIKLENDWTSMSSEVEEHEKSIGKCEFIKSILKKSEIESILGIIATLEKNMEKTGFLSNIANFSSISKLKKILKLKDFTADYENLGRLKSELEVAAMVWKLRKIESDIQKTGNLHVLSEQIRQMKKKQKPLAINILKARRRESLKELLRDQVKRNRL